MTSAGLWQTGGPVPVSGSRRISAGLWQAGRPAPVSGRRAGLWQAGGPVPFSGRQEDQRRSLAGRRTSAGLWKQENQRRSLASGEISAGLWQAEGPAPVSGSRNASHTALVRNSNNIITINPACCTPATRVTIDWSLVSGHSVHGPSANATAVGNGNTCRRRWAAEIPQAK